MEEFLLQVYNILIYGMSVLLFVSIYREFSRRFTDMTKAGGHSGIHQSGEQNEAMLASPPTLGQALVNLFQRQTLIQIAKDMLLMALVNTLMALLSSQTSGGLERYMTAYLPMMGVMLMLFTFTEATGGSRIFATIIGILILTGVCLQNLLSFSLASISLDETVMFSVISMALAIAGAFVLYFLLHIISRKKAYIILNAALLVLYLLLLVLGSRINGTKAWLVIGGISLQLTELCKVISLIIFGMVFSDKEHPPLHSLLRALVTLGINGVCLALVNELGTLCLIGLAFVLMAFMSQPKLKHLMLVTAALLVICVFALFLCYQCYQIENPPAAATEAVTETATEAVTETATEAATGVSPEAATETAAEDTGKKEDKLSITGLGAKIWTKFDERLSVYLHPEDADPLDDAYQIDQSLKALSLSSWFGSGYNWRVPVMESDYVFTFLVLKMGTIYGILILILLTLMLLIGMQTALTCKNDMISFVGMSFILSLAFQSMISAASSTGSFMVVGLPFCFLGAGGTSAVTNYLMAVFVIYTTGHQKLPQPKAQTVPQQEQVRPAARKTRKERN